MALGASSAASAGAGGAHTYGKMEIESTVDRAAKGDTISEMINGEASPLPDADEATFVVRVLRNAYSVILTVMTFAVSISLLNITKWIYVTYNYRFPLFLTATHMVGSYIFAFFAIHIFKLCPDRRILSLKEQIYTVAPFSLMGAASIACGNMALVHLYPSFHEMLQNSTPIWTVLAAVILQRKQYNWMTWVSMIPVCAGGALCAYGEQSTFLYIGLVFSIMACVFRSVRAIVQGELLQGQEKIDSITLLYYAAPFNLALFLGGSFYLEGLEPWVNWVEYLEPRGKMWVFLGAGAAAMYNLLAYLMVGHMGAVATMVVNNLKTPSIIVLSTMIFGNPITMLQLAGFGVATFGAYVYGNYSSEIRAPIPIETAAVIEDDDLEEMTSSPNLRGSHDDLEFGLDDDEIALKDVVGQGDSTSPSVTAAQE